MEQAMNNIPIIDKRRLQAEVVGPLFKEMVDQLGQHKAERILESAIQKAAIDEGRRFATQVASSNQSPLRRFIDLFEQWTTGGALEVDTLLESDERFEFNVTRCRYAEMYQEMGLGHIGQLLSCSRDGTFCEGFDDRITLKREQTIMDGAPCCTFRYACEIEPDTES
ncbi:uncharacterized protein METZ01_LOCUS278022 [marine metagenome]|uniref:L-2-amino-thiazoline-4-carboxylic acid hydrolase n=1 Tax=marine metagenome TaxID=408172 RepID=A0A382KL21_9ZZZZ